MKPEPDNDKLVVIALLVAMVGLWILGFMSGFLPGNE